MIHLWDFSLGFENHIPVWFGTLLYQCGSYLSPGKGGPVVLEFKPLYITFWLCPNGSLAPQLFYVFLLLSYFFSCEEI